jgi:hypothetical protein
VRFGLPDLTRRAAVADGGRHCAPYSGPMNPRVRRLIVSGVLGGLVLIVVLAAIWDLLH